MNFKLTSIIGTRPQFIKASTVSRRLKGTSIQETILHTGQHYDEYMSDVFFKEMKLDTPKYVLNINNMSHGAMVGRMVESSHFAEEGSF